MEQHLDFYPTDKTGLYTLLAEQLKALVENEPHPVPNLANASALLFYALKDINWVGFYLMAGTDTDHTSPAAPEAVSTAAAEANAHAAAPTEISSPAAAPAGISSPALSHTPYLLLGPFQGKTACIRIPLGRGVCGIAAASGELQLVPDVHEFPGHIACDSASASEIVLPLKQNGRVVGVLDIDSPLKNRFDEADAKGLQALVEILEQTCVF